MFSSEEKPRCPKCNGHGGVEVRVYHVYPDGDEVDAGYQRVDCHYCDATGEYNPYKL